MKKLNEGTIKELPNELKVMEVNKEIPKQLDKVNKKDKDFEEFLTLYTPLINDRFIEQYGNLEDKDLWNDLAKEMFLKSKYYILKGDEVKPEKMQESKKLQEDLERVQKALLSKAKSWAKEQDDEYYNKLVDKELIEEYFSSLYEDDIMDLCKELEIDTYNGNLQLSDAHVLYDISYGLNDNVQMPDETIYGDDVTIALETFEDDCKELDGEVYTDGRMGRHIVIKPTLSNILNYDTIKEQYMEAQQTFINNEVEYLNSLSKEEESVQVGPETDNINIEEDIFNTFSSAKPFEANFGKLYVIKDKYDKLYKIYKPNKLNINDYIYYTDSEAGIQGFLDGAIKANNGIFNDLKTEAICKNGSKEKLEEDNYNTGIFYEIEQAFEEAGLQPIRFTDDGILTKNIGWTVTSPETGKHQQISCDGSWYSEDEELDENKNKNNLKESIETNSEEGTCPVCHSDDLDYSPLNVDGSDVVYPFTCNSCNAEGNEYYNMKFSEIIDSHTDESSKDEGVCPKCGADLDYGSLVPEGTDIYYEVECPKCDFVGKEWYDLSFVGQEVKNNKKVTELYDPIESKLPDLAAELQEFIYDFDTYDYKDTYTSDEEAIEEIQKSLCNVEDRKGIIEKLNTIIEEDNLQEIKDKAKELISRVDNFSKELKQEDIEMTTTKQNLQDVKEVIDNKLGNVFGTEFVDGGDVVGLKLTRKQNKIDLIPVMDNIISSLDQSGYDKTDYEIELIGDDLILGMNNIAK